MSTFVTRYQIQDLSGRAWDGVEFTADEDAAVEYRFEDEAYDEADALTADVIFAEVVEYRRWSRYGDPVGLHSIHAIAAE